MREAGAATGFAIEPLGETMLVLRFGECLDAGLNARVHATAATLRAADLPGVIDLVPAYAALALVYAPAVWASDAEPAWQALAEAVRTVLARPPPQAALAVATIEVPVCYGGAFGPDLDGVAGQCRLSADALIARHAAAEYRSRCSVSRRDFPICSASIPRCTCRGAPVRACACHVARSRSAAPRPASIRTNCRAAGS